MRMIVMLQNLFIVVSPQHQDKQVQAARLDLPDNLWRQYREIHKLFLL